MSEDQLRQQLYDAFANRAHIYHLLFTQLRSELGPEKAAELMGRAIYQRGVQKAAKYASFAPGDLAGLGRAFVASLPDDGAMFAPEVVRCDAEGLDIKFQRCPLQQAWLDADLAPEEMATLCRIKEPLRAPPIGSRCRRALTAFSYLTVSCTRYVFTYLWPLIVLPLTFAVSPVPMPKTKVRLTSMVLSVTVAVSVLPLTKTMIADPWIVLSVTETASL